jgi:hypothetical protein
MYVTIYSTEVYCSTDNFQLFKYKNSKNKMRREVGGEYRAKLQQHRTKAQKESSRSKSGVSFIIYQPIKKKPINYKNSRIKKRKYEYLKQNGKKK